MSSMRTAKVVYMDFYLKPNEMQQIKVNMFIEKALSRNPKKNKNKFL